MAEIIIFCCRHGKTLTPFCSRGKTLTPSLKLQLKLSSITANATPCFRRDCCGQGGRHAYPRGPLPDTGGPLLYRVSCYNEHNDGLTLSGGVRQVAEYDEVEMIEKGWVGDGQNSCDMLDK